MLLHFLPCVLYPLLKSSSFGYFNVFKISFGFLLSLRYFSLKNLILGYNSLLDLLDCTTYSKCACTTCVHINESHLITLKHLDLK